MRPDHRCSLGRVLTRRALLGGATAAALSGCAVLPPGEGRSPAPAPTGDPLPGQRAVSALRTALLDALGTGSPPSRAALVGWALDVNDDQHEAVSLMLPPTPRPTPSITVDPSPSSPAPTGAGDRLVTALRTAGEGFAAQALDPASARPLVWASMAAWAAALSSHLPAASVTPEPARGVRLPAPQQPEEAAQAALDAAGATLYGLEVAAGAPGLSPEDSAALADRLAFWAGLRDDLTASIRAGSGTPAPAPPWFGVGLPPDATSARALVARLQASALTILGRSLAHGPEGPRPVLAAALADVAADVPRWGGLLERWPGLPVT